MSRTYNHHNFIFFWPFKWKRSRDQQCADSCKYLGLGIRVKLFQHFGQQFCFFSVNNNYWYFRNSLRPFRVQCRNFISAFNWYNIFSSHQLDFFYVPLSHWLWKYINRNFQFHCESTIYQFQNCSMRMTI